MSLNLVEICTLKYPGQIEAGNISFRKPDNEILFGEWKVPGIPRPKESEVLAEADAWDLPYQMSNAFNTYSSYIDTLLDSTANSRSYGSAVAVATYVSSTNDTWRNEAVAFVAWRDAVFNYALKVQKDVQEGMKIPSLDDFISGIPAITW